MIPKGFHRSLLLATENMVRAVEILKSRGDEIEDLGILVRVQDHWQSCTAEGELPSEEQYKDGLRGTLRILLEELS